jgi:hypothetical protein
MNECLFCSRFRYSILSALQSYGLIFNADKLLLGLVAITGNNLSHSGVTRASDFFNAMLSLSVFRPICKHL